MRALIFPIAILIFAGSGCGQAERSEGPASDAHLVAAVADVGRRAADRERDTNRRPQEVLTFFGIEPGMTVLEVFSGGGYYTEILSRAVGDEGQVHAHNNAAYVAYVQEEIDERYRDGRLANVRQLRAENNELDLTADAYDAVLLILGYHDVYFVDADNGWPRIDAPKLLAEIREGLKPGGVFGVVDHAAAAGAPAEVGGTLHRIDPSRLQQDMEVAGFVLDGESGVLRNPDDDLSLTAFDDKVRGRTDRVVYRYR